MKCHSMWTGDVTSTNNNRLEHIFHFLYLIFCSWILWL
jgi:hypothetical protein